MPCHEAHWASVSREESECGWHESAGHQAVKLRAHRLGIDCHAAEAQSHDPAQSQPRARHLGIVYGSLAEGLGIAHPWLQNLGTVPRPGSDSGWLLVVGQHPCSQRGHLALRVSHPCSQRGHLALVSRPGSGSGRNWAAVSHPNTQQSRGASAHLDTALERVQVPAQYPCSLWWQRAGGSRPSKLQSWDAVTRPDSGSGWTVAATSLSTDDHFLHI